MVSAYFIPLAFTIGIILGMFIMAYLVLKFPVNIANLMTDELGKEIWKGMRGK